MPADVALAISVSRAAQGTMPRPGGVLESFAPGPFRAVWRHQASAEANGES